MRQIRGAAAASISPFRQRPDRLHLARGFCKDHTRIGTPQAVRQRASATARARQDITRWQDQLFRMHRLPQRAFLLPHIHSPRLTVATGYSRDGHCRKDPARSVCAVKGRSDHARRFCEPGVTLDALQHLLTNGDRDHLPLCRRRQEGTLEPEGLCRAGRSEVGTGSAGRRQASDNGIVRP